MLRLGGRSLSRPLMNRGVTVSLVYGAPTGRSTTMRPTYGKSPTSMNGSVAFLHEFGALGAVPSVPFTATVPLAVPSTASTNIWWLQCNETRRYYSSRTASKKQVPATAPPTAPKAKEGETVDASKSPPADANSKVDSSPELNMASLRKVLGYMGPLMWPRGRPDLKARVVVAFGLTIFTKVLNVYVPIQFKALVDSLVPTAVAAANPAPAIAASLVLAYGLVRLGQSLTAELRHSVFANVQQHASKEITMRVFRQLHTLDLDFHLSRKTGSLSKYLDRGVRGFTTMAWLLLFMLIPTVWEMGLVCCVLQSQVGLEYVVTAVLSVGGYFAFTWFVTNLRSRYRDTSNKLENEVGAITVDSLLNFETVRYFNNQQHEASRLDRKIDDYNVYQVRLAQSLAALNFGQSAIFIVATAGSMWLAVHGICAGTLTVGDLVLVNTLLMQLSQPLYFLGTIYREVATATLDMQQMFSLMNYTPSVVNAPNAKPYEHQNGTIEFRNVKFNYGERVIFDGLSFKIEGGSTVAIVGSSGCGKSTVVRLLFRSYEVDGGEILMDGHDIRTLTKESVQKHIGVIPQDTVLFNDTIKYNIHYGNPEANDAIVYEAAASAHLEHSIARMADGYDTVVGERGLKLSGGEKQRVAIARVLVKGAPVLIADEATSALDSKTEVDIMKTLRGAAQRKTLILIAHRLSTVKDANQIIVLDGNGRVAEIGSHSHLIAKQGVYASMWEHQKHEKAEESADGKSGDKRRSARSSPRKASG